jgi:HK97 family phage portal protein
MTKSLIGKIVNQAVNLPVGDARGYGGARSDYYASSRSTQLDSLGSTGTLYAIVQLLAFGQAKSEWQMFRKNTDSRRRYASTDIGSDQRVEVTQHQALKLWNRPNDFMTGSDFREIGWQFMELVGEWYWVLNRGASGLGIPVEMWPVRPDRMEPVPDREEFLKGWIYTGPNGEKVPLDNSEVIQVKYPNPTDLYRGLSPVQSIMADIDSAKYTAQWSRNFFLNSAQPGGIVTFSKRLSDDEFDEFNARWRESHQGVAKGHRVGVLEQGATWNPNTYSMREMQFVDFRKVTRDVIREAYRIHQSMLGNSDDVNRANAQTAEDVHVAWHEVTRLRRTRLVLNEFFLPMFAGTSDNREFDFRDPTPTDGAEANAELTAKSAAAAVLIKAGFDPSDVLEVVGLPEMGWKAPAPPVVHAPPGKPALNPGEPGAADPGSPDAPPGQTQQGSTPVQNHGLTFAADTPGGEAATERLRQYWTHGAGAAKIRWGEPGDFDRCVREVTEHAQLSDPKGYCADRHHDALGVWPGQEKGMVSPTVAADVIRSAFRDAIDDSDYTRIAEELRSGLSVRGNGHKELTR